MIEEVVAPAARIPVSARSAVLPIAEAGEGQGEVRLAVGIGELDRVLGGGLVTGSVTLLGGDPGIGKSTLLLLAAERLARRGLRVLYVSGEESARQVRLRAERLGTLCPDLLLLTETSFPVIRQEAEQLRPALLVIDSVQTLQVPELDASPGSISQVREVAARVTALAKGRDIATVLVGHVTKDGALAGPRALEHLVDTVLYLEGDGSNALRVLRTTKNRFGSTGEIGLFEMVEAGLAEVPDASARLLLERARGAPGTVVTCTMEGSRPVLVEVQALVGPPGPGTPGRTTIGLDRARLVMLLAVLGKCGLDLTQREVFASVAGGLRVGEPAVDLAIAMAVASSARDVALPADLAVIGEIGLVGELRGVSLPALRLQELRRHGFRAVWGPRSLPADLGMSIRGVRGLADLVAGEA
jgi:DNA repair protein RadA/Sms